MEILERLRQWLLTYPGWGGYRLTVGCTDGTPGSAGLFLTGMEELERQADLQGNSLVRNRLRLLLRRNGPPPDGQGEDSGWQLELAAWIRQQSIAGTVPQLGCIADGQRMQVKQGKLARVQGQTLAVYETELLLDYWEYWEVPQNDEVL